MIVRTGIKFMGCSIHIECESVKDDHDPHGSYATAKCAERALTRYLAEGARVMGTPVVDFYSYKADINPS